MSNLVTLSLIGCAMAIGPRAELTCRAVRAWVRHRYGT
jgi:hypothetical protein